MKREVLLVAVAVGAVFAFSGVSAAQEPPARDSVTTVSGTEAGPDFPPFGREFQDIEIDASSGPSGENPAGTVSYVNTDVLRTVSGRVTCLAVRGDTATINTVGYFGIVTFQVVDNQPDTFNSARTGDIDFANVDFTNPDASDYTGRAPTDCSTLVTPSEAATVVTGDIRVIDAQPARPTSKRKCKKGGWRRFGFKNQGRCIAFVNRGAKR